MNYWQIASGSAQRDYHEAFLKYGMAFVGGDDKAATMEKIATGDRVLLKRGLKEVIAAGVVIEREGKCGGNADKKWLTDFDGWDLYAYCYVERHEPEAPIAVTGLTRSTICNVYQQQLIDLTNKLISDYPPKINNDPEPRETNTVDYDKILMSLIGNGLRPGAAEDLTNAFSRISMLAKYYYNNCQWEDIREHETRTFLIIPLLLAMGWAEQQIKIELAVKDRRRADVACFIKPYKRAEGVSNDDDCVLIIESKGFSQGLDYAPDQAKQYAAHFRNCKVIAVSNGFCYKIYIRETGGIFSGKPSAYVNLLKPTEEYPLNPDNVKGCLEALRLLLPSSYI